MAASSGSRTERPRARASARDIRPGLRRAPSCRMLGALDGRLYFMATDGVHGEELWRSDGTEAGTVLVKEIRPGAGGLYLPGFRHRVRTDLLRSVRRRPGVRSSGRPTARRPGRTRWARSILSRLTASGNLLYFTDYDASKLFRSDGTAAGTTQSCTRARSTRSTCSSAPRISSISSAATSSSGAPTAPRPATRAGPTTSGQEKRARCDPSFRRTWERSARSPSSPRTTTCTAWSSG